MACIAAPIRAGVISGALASKLSSTVRALATTEALSTAPTSCSARTCDWTVASPCTAAATAVRILLELALRSPRGSAAREAHRR